MKKLWWLCCLVVLAAGLAGGCGKQIDEAHTVVLYSDLHETFLQAM